MPYRFREPANFAEAAFQSSRLTPSDRSGLSEKSCLLNRSMYLASAVFGRGRSRRPAHLCCATAGRRSQWANDINYGAKEQARSDSATADQSHGRQHAFALVVRADPGPLPASQEARAHLLARHDGCPDRVRLRPWPGRRAQRRKALRQGGAWRAQAGARSRRRRVVHRQHQRAELEQGAQHPAAPVRQPCHAVLPPEHGRYRRAAGQEMGAAQRRRFRGFLQERAARKANGAALARNAVLRLPAPGSGFSLCRRIEGVRSRRHCRATHRTTFPCKTYCRTAGEALEY